MLNEATKIINNAFNQSFIKRLSLYLHDCVREEVKSSTFRNLNQDKDNKWVFLNEKVNEETFFKNYPKNLVLNGLDSQITELMIQSDMNQKDKHLIYGFLFLEGRSSKSKKNNEFLTPLLYTSVKLERNEKDIICTSIDENISLNTGALAALLSKNDTNDEDETNEQMLFGLLDVVPELPLTKDALDIFLTTLKSLIPEIEYEKELLKEIVANDNCSKDEKKEIIIQENDENESETNDFGCEANIDENSEEKPKTIKLKKICLTSKSALILTKRPSITAGVLHELTQIAEKPQGIFRETALNCINEEYEESKSHKKVTNPNFENETKNEFFPIVPLAISDAQEKVIEGIANNTIVSVFGPPGSGKSQTIVNLISHLIANGKTVLIASRMDKAVDVVCERLNDLEAPFLALRAGRLNYQKKLSQDLENLISNNVNLDYNCEDYILTQNEDMKKLLDLISELENKCENIIKLEHQWHSVYCEFNELNEIIQNNFNILKLNLTTNDVILLEKLIDEIENAFESKNIFKSFFSKLKFNKLKKELKLKKIDFNVLELEKIKQELSLSKLNAKLKDIETQIYKLGNIHVLTNEIKNNRDKISGLAKNIIKNKRRNALKNLLADNNKIRRLKVHSKAIIQRKKNLQTRLLEEEDFKPLLEAFPCWGITTYQVSNSLPLKPGLFDVVIIDEASQCDIASCIPLLYRAKKAVIVGDDKQLPHLSFLEKTKEQSYLAKYEIPDKYQLMWQFRTNSMFDLANYYSNAQVLLDEHFRSFPPIINFSNKEFYNNNIKVMKEDDQINKSLELNVVENGKIDYGVTRNEVEIEAIIKRLYQIILEDEKSEKPLSIGIISPFRAQVDAIKKALYMVLTTDVIERHKIEVGTAHTFQGDERDIIIISWALAQNSYFQSLTFLQKPNLFNVAITRAKKKVISFISKDPKTLNNGLLKDYLEYIQHYNNKNESEVLKVNTNNYKNEFEKEVANALKEAGYEVVENVKLANFNCDLKVIDKNSNKKVFVEVDGVDDNKKSQVSNMKKQAIIQRCGFKVVRISYREWLLSQKICIERIAKFI